jgi:hypothetical protein
MGLWGFGCLGILTTSVLLILAITCSAVVTGSIGALAFGGICTFAGTGGSGFSANMGSAGYFRTTLDPMKLLLLHSVHTVHA